MKFRVHFKQKAQDSEEEFDHGYLDVNADNSVDAIKIARKKLGVIIVKKTKQLKEVENA